MESREHRWNLSNCRPRSICSLGIFSQALFPIVTKKKTKKKKKQKNKKKKKKKTKKKKKKKE